MSSRLRQRRDRPTGFIIHRQGFDRAAGQNRQRTERYREDPSFMIDAPQLYRKMAALESFMGE